jgi:hypothetical protein
VIVPVVALLPSLCTGNVYVNVVELVTVITAAPKPVSYNWEAPEISTVSPLTNEVGVSVVTVASVLLGAEVMLFTWAVLDTNDSKAALGVAKIAGMWVLGESSGTRLRPK